ncbi:hypothetical protein DsansV1_C20g0165641 [Dioscorea sansibarensis]
MRTEGEARIQARSKPFEKNFPSAAVTRAAAWTWAMAARMDPTVVRLRRCWSEPVRVRRYTLPRFSKLAMRDNKEAGEVAKKRILGETESLCSHLC